VAASETRAIVTPKIPPIETDSALTVFGTRSHTLALRTKETVFRKMLREAARRSTGLSKETF